MKKLDPSFYEDRALRNAAREVFLTDLAHVRASLSGGGIASRMVDRVGEGAKDVLETAKDRADDNPGIIAALVGAILLWISREPIFELLGLTSEENEQVDPDYDNEALEDGADQSTPSGDPDD